MTYCTKIVVAVYEDGGTETVVLILREASIASVLPEDIEGPSPIGGLAGREGAISPIVEDRGY
jgi:hypothetical protein